jgi:hypothetical protein
MTQEALKKLNLALETMEAACKRIDELVAENKALKEALAQPEQELVADDFFKMIADRNPKPFPLPQRTWVGLAAEDRLTAKYMQDAPDGIEAVIDYIEAKLKERNT